MEQGLRFIPEQSHHHLNPLRSTVPIYRREHYGEEINIITIVISTGIVALFPSPFNRKSGFQALNNRASLLWLGPCCQLEGP
jgi:hypothetical protein